MIDAEALHRSPVADERPGAVHDLRGHTHQKAPERARVLALIVCGCTITNVAFVLPTWDTWMRLIVALSVLGSIGLLASWSQPSVWRRPRAGEIVLAALSGVMIYASAWVLSGFAPVGGQMALLDRWSAGRPAASIAVTVPLAVLGEELFWRATVLRLAVDRFGMRAGIVLATGAYALAHVASGTWLLPVAAFSAGVLWAALFVGLRNLAAPIVSHFVFDTVLLLVAPLP